MALTSQEFRAQVLAPNLDDLEREYGKIHRAFNAVAAVDAYAAHIFIEAKARGVDPYSALGLNKRNMSDSAFREALSEEHQEFRVLRDLAKANKHAELTYRRHQVRVPDSGRTTAKSKGWGEGRWGEGRYGGVHQVFVSDAGGAEHYIETLVKRSVMMLDGAAEKLGLIQGGNN